MATCQKHDREVTRQYCPVSGRYRPICPDCERETYQRTRQEFAEQ